MKKVFLGGTCNGSVWRDIMISHLTNLDLRYFNPVVEDWTEECMAEEIKQRETCDFCLYTLTPRMTGVYSIAELTEDAIKRPDKTVFVMLREDDELRFDAGQWMSLEMVAKLVESNGAKVFKTMIEAAHYMAE